jgi:hypothetical protein
MNSGDVQKDPLLATASTSLRLTCIGCKLTWINQIFSPLSSIAVGHPSYVVSTKRPNCTTSTSAITSIDQLFLVDDSLAWVPAASPLNCPPLMGYAGPA